MLCYLIVKIVSLGWQKQDITSLAFFIHKRHRIHLQHFKFIIDLHYYYLKVSLTLHSVNF